MAERDVTSPCSRKRRLGFTLIEVSLGLALGLSLIVGAIILLSQVRAHREVNETAVHLDMVVGEVERYFGPDYSGIRKGTLDPTGKFYVEGFGAKTFIPAEILSNITFFPAASNTTYCMDVHELERRSCYALGRRFAAQSGKFTQHPIQCASEPTRLRFCRIVSAP